MPAHRIFLQFALIALFLLAATACRPAASGPPARSLIRDPGTTTLPTGATLLIWQDTAGTVSIRLEDAGRIIASDTFGSVHSRWFFDVTANGWLWGYNGDLGVRVWTPDAEGVLVGVDQRPDSFNPDVISEASQVFIDALPASYRDVWKSSP